jgi:hypothetical protein
MAVRLVSYVMDTFVLFGCVASRFSLYNSLHCDSWTRLLFIPFRFSLGDSFRELFQFLLLEFHDAVFSMPKQWIPSFRGFGPPNYLQRFDIPSQ